MSSSSTHLSRSWPESCTLSIVLSGGSIISGTNANDIKVSNDLSDVLRSRLEKFDELIDGVTRHRAPDLESLKLDTAFASLYVLERVHAALQQDEDEAKARASHEKGEATPPLIGSRDMAQLRTHLAVVYNWGTVLLLLRILPTLPNKRSPRLPPGAQIIDLTAAFEDYTLLSGMLNRLLYMLFPDGVQGRVAATFVAMLVLSRSFSDLLRPCICLAWLPNELRGDLPPAGDLKSYTMRLLNCVPPSQTIASLGQILSKPSSVPVYVCKVCSMLLSGQLLRPAGVAGLLSATFGEDIASTGAPLQKLESVSKVLNLVPSNTPREIYYALIIPRLLFILSPGMNQKTPPSHKRVAAFSLSRMLTAPAEGDDAEHDVQRCIVNWCLLDSLRTPSPEGGDKKPAIEGLAKARDIAKQTLIVTPVDAAMILSTILTNTDPSPELISVLLQPVVPQLYSLSEYLRGSKTADPAVRETVEGLLGTWARAADREEVVDTLWEVVDGGNLDWAVDDAGELRLAKGEARLPSLTLAQLADLQEGKLDTEEDEEANLLNLRPHPLHFATLLKSINREDVSSALYLRILDAHVKSDNDENPLRKLLLFKLTMQISAQVGASASAGSPLKRPDVSRMLMFIKLSLDQNGSLTDRDSTEKLTLDSLRLVPEEDKQEANDDGDSDDEDLAPGLEGVDKSEHMSVTAVNLLLALLEEYPDLSPRSVPLLNDVYIQLEPLANSPSDALRPRAREARLTLTARLASALPSKNTREDSVGEEGPQEKYQRALKLLQDPLLPVRAHGLLLLRELVAPAKKIKEPVRNDGESGTGATVTIVQGEAIAAPSVEPALVPAVLSIFMQSIQDEDSYIFLNSVQGLAAMVDGFGKEVLRALVDEYSRGLVGTSAAIGSMTARQVDKHVRVGEALGEVIKRCGDALGKYVDIILPSVFAIVRAPQLPTTLRTSAVSLLATAADTSAIALSAYTGDLVSAMIDLVQVESVSATRAGAGAKKAASGAEEVPASSKFGGKYAAGTGDVRNKDPTVMGEGGSGPREMKAQTDRGGDDEIDRSRGGSVTMDNQPTAANPRFPPLRRAALHFLSLLVRALTARAYEGEGVGPGTNVPGLLMKRGGIVLGYVSATDEDGVVRVMAREAAEQLEQLRKAVVGL
ncbi:hypothetical protein M0805_001124 [Coniferiporia weirii]|nr:hypothetical protein M0805_001124 [Coniferiporia weirii]